jgi:inhibitor of growth protein 4
MNALNVIPFFFNFSNFFSYFYYLIFGFFLAMMNQTRQQTTYCLGLASQSSKKGNNYNNNNNSNYNYSNYNSSSNNNNSNEEDEAAFEKMRKDIEGNQDNALSLCTEKVLLAQQAYDLVLKFYHSFI